MMEKATFKASASKRIGSLVDWDEEDAGDEATAAEDSSTDFAFLIFFLRTILKVVTSCPSLFTLFTDVTDGVGGGVDSLEGTLVTTGGLLSDKELDEDEGDREEAFFS